ncbi:MAG TPA: RNA polymerase sigma factor [bacterium]|nr:RNA polymerase sigma factor [bacterium]HPL95808.1 RNA polymerase sigma factor [bacterium]
MTVKIREQLLIRRIQRNDGEAFGEIYDQYLKKIYRFVFFRVNTKETAEDIVQDVFTSLLNYLKNKETEIKSLQAFIYQIARNKIADHYQKTNREALAEWPENESEITENKEEIDLDENMDNERALEKITEAVKEIKNQVWQEIIIMHYIEDLSVSEIAEILEKKTGTVRVILHRALQDLKKQINKINK